jgi:hypothetical protein
MQRETVRTKEMKTKSFVEEYFLPQLFFYFTISQHNITEILNTNVNHNTNTFVALTAERHSKEENKAHEF